MCIRDRGSRTKAFQMEHPKELMDIDALSAKLPSAMEAQTELDESASVRSLAPGDVSKQLTPLNDPTTQLTREFDAVIGAFANI